MWMCVPHAAAYELTEELSGWYAVIDAFLEARKIGTGQAYEEQLQEALEAGGRLARGRIDSIHARLDAIEVRYEIKVAR